MQDVRHLPDYARGWYLSLYLAAQETEGRVLVTGSLWQVAGARSQGFFEREFACVSSLLQTREIGCDIYIVFPELERQPEVQPKVPDLEKSEKVGEREILKIYEVYPRKTQKTYALKCIRKAVLLLSKENKITPQEAAELIYCAVVDFSRSPQGKRGHFTPHCSTWMNRGQFLDDRQQWQLEKDNGRGKTAQEERELRSADNIRRGIAAVLSRTRQEE